MRLNEEKYVGRPISGLQQMLRRISFRDAAIPRIAETGEYDAATENAVYQYQRTRGLDATGITDKRTWDNIAAEFRNIEASERIINWPLYGDWRLAARRNESHPIIYLAQAMFMALSELMPEGMNIQANGVNDDATAGAIMWLQNRTGLEEDGIMDKFVWESLSGLYYTELTRNFDYLPRPYTAASLPKEGIESTMVL